jgi:hypothetical protein
MKTTLSLLVAFFCFAQPALASIQCSRPGITTLTFASDEGVAGNLVRIQITAKFLKKDLVFSAAKGAVLAVDAQVSESAEETVYMAGMKGALATLTLPNRIPEGKTAPGILYVTAGKQIVKELLDCSDDSYEGN